MKLKTVLTEGGRLPVGNNLFTTALFHSMKTVLEVRLNFVAVVFSRGLGNAWYW